jgi:hypothetical protein
MSGRPHIDALVEDLRTLTERCSENDAVMTAAV